jgi:hypothetical protein
MTLVTITKEMAEVAAKKLRAELPKGFVVRVIPRGDGDEHMLEGGIPSDEGIKGGFDGDGDRQRYKAGSYWAIAPYYAEGHLMAGVYGEEIQEPDDIYQAVEYVIGTINKHYGNGKKRNLTLKQKDRYGWNG